MGRAVPAASRALDILELFLDTPLLSAAEVVTRLGLPRTTTHELLGTLVDRRYLLLVPGQPLRYRLGVRLFQLGSIFAQHLDLARESQRIAAEIGATCEETVHVAVLEGRDVIYIVRVESTHPVRMVSAVGRRLPAHCTGVGKMLLSEFAPQEIDALYAPDETLSPMTANSISSVARLKTELAAIHERSLSYDEAESSEDVHCVAAGIRDDSGAMVAAISISVPTTRWNESSRSSWSALVRDGADRLSESLGYFPQAHRTP
jgi:IclR family KDG regulon transcriptional repressor